MTRDGPGLYYKQNRLQQLRGFYHVAISHSFTVAAARMSLEQPTVALQVQALERELEAKLFVRRRGATNLTQEGEVLFELAAPVVEAIESLQEAFHERLGQFEVGNVICAAPEFIVLHVLPGLIGQFKARFPHVDLVVHSTSPSSYALDMVLRGEAELGIGALTQVPSNMIFQPLVSYNNYLVVPRDHPLVEQATVSLQDVVKYPLVAPLEDGATWQALYRAMQVQHLDCQVAIRLASTEARLRYVLSGIGITVASGAGRTSEIASQVEWVPLAEDMPTTTYGLIRRKNTYLSLPAKRFAEFLVSATPIFRSFFGTLPSLGAATDK